MKLLLLFPIILLFFSCNENDQSSKSAAALVAMVDTFEEKLGERTTKLRAGKKLTTEVGVFSISNEEATISEQGKLMMEGETRTEGYFITPRKVWVKDAAEAKKLLLEDYYAKLKKPE